MLSSYLQNKVVEESTVSEIPEELITYQEDSAIAEVQNYASMYGFKLDDRFHVVNTAEKPVENLFAVGELTMGNYFFQEYVSTSCAVACAVYGGSLAADEAVAEIARG